MSDTRRPTYVSRPDLYTVNALNSFSFGNVQTSVPVTSPSIGPLDDPDDDAPGTIDVTPRPSVVDHNAYRSSQYRGSPYRSHSSQNYDPGHDPGPPLPSRRDPSRNHSSDTASRRTFETSSASASVTSLSSMGPSSSHLTSATTTDDEREERGVEFDDDYNDYHDDDIEISSVMYEGSSVEGPAVSGRWMGSLSSFASGYGERRVSLPIAVPGSSSASTSNDGRRTDILTLRRPSKSLDEDSMLSNIHSSADCQTSSLPESDGDWRSLNAKGKGKAREESLPPLPAKVTVESQDFDLDWNAFGRGIISFDQPISDIVSTADSRRGSTSRSLMTWGRRPSTATTGSSFSNDDIFTRHVAKGDPYYKDQRKVWTFRRDQSEGSGGPPVSKKGGLLSPRGSMNERELSEREKREKEARSVANWNGMPPNSHEIWRNPMVGRFKVERRTTPRKEESSDVTVRGPVQRLLIDHFRDGSPTKQDDPCVTVHKHSKTVAFSISRAYRSRRRRSYATRPTSSTTSSSMILLAPRSVQEAYTSTTTTRKLESHGLLDERRERDKSVGRKEKEKDRRRKVSGTDDSSKKSRKKNEQSSVGSVTSRPVSTTETTSYGPPPSSASSSTTDHSTSSSIRPLRRRRRDTLDSDDDIPPRTPHSETYGTIDVAELNQLRARQHQTHHSTDDLGGSFWNRFRRGRSTRAVNGQLPAQRDVSYQPPWVTLESRNRQEQTQRVVDNLNHSFQEVGLLQVNTKPKPGASRSKTKARVEKAVWTEIFKEIPEESLYMLIPLWPSDTDPVSAQIPYERPVVDRQYLLVCYKAPETSQPAVKHSKKRSVENKSKSPTSSWDSSMQKRDERNILLNEFRITGRLVSHADIQGSGMRVSEGIIVTGSLKEAYDTRPPLANPGTRLIGQCRNREQGVEFDSDGLLSLGVVFDEESIPSWHDR
ncbi:uncharacterized protein EV420DRAFT_1644748 [Desarmillaria tabescens]|uniref:Uncharacterized protein n=1 Tax=Armillaria tabescens TaxID=1929756 RepID=A0AA39K6K9_ARMTA|nr:uncharacterized protein EV420DRAFT_1644748 [Desarmillaria tabescens]KAK0455519.1 hypothetical protein EV420DRAFT_1644748 [Desarmillaria tabescens]